MIRRAKIVATIGPASASKSKMKALINAGMNIARLNFSHGTHDEHAAYISRLRAVAKELRKPIGILQDLQGPKIRVGELEKPIPLKTGDKVILYIEGEKKPQRTGKMIPVDLPQIIENLQPNDHLLLDDGRIALSIISREGEMLRAEVLLGGLLKSNKGINLPGVKLPISGFTEKDAQDLAFGLSQGIDAVAISFVRSKEDILMVREAIKKYQPKASPLIIAKLERPEIFDDLDSILDAVDGVMIARGDLGVEMPPERVPVLQKRIIQAANAKAKLVITATQMLESMIENPLPTRAEASDVANAIFDDTDAVMLSAESAAGKYPVETVAMMGRIIREAEADFREWGHARGKEALSKTDMASIARAADELAHSRDVEAISVFTMSGTTARVMSKVRPDAPIFAFTPDLKTFAHLAFMWGVEPILVPYAKTLEEMLASMDELLLAGKMVGAGKEVVLVCGFPVGAMLPPNMALLHRVGDGV